MNAPGTLSPGGNPLRDIPERIWAGGGLTLGQIKDMTGLDAPAIQNWIKRGYVAPPSSRKYSKDKTARILIINALRESMKLETIARLIGYVNGSLIDTSDDLIPDSELYDMFCVAVEVFGEDLYAGDERLTRGIAAGCERFENPVARKRIEETLTLMCAYYRSILIKRTVENLIEAL